MIPLGTWRSTIPTGYWQWTTFGYVTSLCAHASNIPVKVSGTVSQIFLQILNLTQLTRQKQETRK